MFSSFNFRIAETLEINPTFSLHCRLKETYIKTKCIHSFTILWSINLRIELIIFYFAMHFRIHYNKPISIRTQWLYNTVIFFFRFYPCAGLHAHLTRDVTALSYNLFMFQVLLGCSWILHLENQSYGYQNHKHVLINLCELVCKHGHCFFWWVGKKNLGIESHPFLALLK